MSTFHIVIDGFADIMEQSCALRNSHIHSALRCKKTCKMSDFDRMIQSILTITGTEL
jgi:hypothetical protein